MTHHQPLARQLADQPKELPERTATAAELAAEAARHEAARQPRPGYDAPPEGQSTTGINARHSFTPRLEDFVHDIRFHGAVGGIGVSVYCQPCHWGVWIDDGHDLADLIRLVAQHAGVADTSVAATETLLALLQPLVVAL